jgi:AcrR family transcriptional regulator
VRDLLLDAAERLLVEGGPDAVRLDAGAAAAGVSKGGLLRHFRSRQSLIGGVLRRRVEAFERQLPPRGAPPGAFTRWLARLLDLAPPRRALHRQVRRRLDDLTDADPAQAERAGT